MFIPLKAIIDRNFSLSSSYRLAVEDTSGESFDQGGSSQLGIYLSLQPWSILRFCKPSSTSVLMNRPSSRQMSMQMELKIMLAHILLNYDFRFPDGITTRPANVYVEVYVAPNTQAKLVFKKRPQQCWPV